MICVGDVYLQRVKKLIGIEMCQEAIEDAEYNARENGQLLSLMFEKHNTHIDLL